MCVARMISIVRSLAVMSIELMNLLSLLDLIEFTLYSYTTTL